MYRTRRVESCIYPAAVVTTAGVVGSSASYRALCVLIALNLRNKDTVSNFPQHEDCKELEQEEE